MVNVRGLLMDLLKANRLGCDYRPTVNLTGWMMGLRLDYH